MIGGDKMLNDELIKSVLIVALSSSVVSSAVIQKVKECLNNKKHLCVFSFIISLIIGTFFAVTFSSCSLMEAIWVGLISWVGAGTLYATFEDKIFKSYSSLKNNVSIESDNNIRSEDE